MVWHLNASMPLNVQIYTTGVVTDSFLPIAVREISLVELPDEVPKSILNLLAINPVRIISLVFRPKVVTKENTGIIKPSHDVSLCFVISRNDCQKAGNSHWLMGSIF